jgi:hypothetical protein
VRARIRSSGADVSEIHNLPTCRVCFATDPDGNRFALHTRVTFYTTPSSDVWKGDTTMQHAQVDVVLKRFESPDEVREFTKGRFEIVRLGGMTIGRATYQPGWRWSTDVGAAMGKTSCDVEHVGMVVSSCATAAMADGTVIEMRAGDVFYIPPGHDSWVVGDEPYVSLHFLGTEDYARK